MGLFMGLRRYGDFLGFTNTAWCKKCKRVRADGSAFAFNAFFRGFLGVKSARSQALLTSVCLLMTTFGFLFLVIHNP
jgi:hypothetical protein